MFRKELLIYTLPEYVMFMEMIQAEISEKLTDIEIKLIPAYFDRLISELVQQVKTEKQQACQLIINELIIRFNRQAFALLVNHARQGRDYEYENFKGFVFHYAYPLKDVPAFIAKNGSSTNPIDGYIKDSKKQMRVILSEYKNGNKQAIVNTVMRNIASLSESMHPSEVLESLNKFITLMKASEDRYYSKLTLFSDFRRSQSSLTIVISKLERCVGELSEKCKSIKEPKIKLGLN